MPGLRGHISRFCWILAVALLVAGCSSPLRKFQVAEQMQKDGKYAVAIRQYAEVLAGLPDEQSQLISLVTVHIAECQWAMGEPKAAFLSLENSLAADPENGHARLRLAEFMLAAGSPQLAIENAQWVLAREPDNLDAFTVLGGAHAVLGDIALAQSVFQRVLTSDPARVEAALTLAQIHAAMGDAGKARTVLLQTAHASSAVTPWLALARLEEEAGNTNTAEENYRKAVAVSKDRQAKLRLAEFLARSSRISEAEQVLGGVDSDVPRSSTVRADFELLLGRAPEAAAGYTFFLTDSPSNRRDPAHAHNPDQFALTRASVIVRLIEAELATAYKQAESGPSLKRAKALLDQYRAELDESASESLQAEMAMVAGDLSQAEAHATRAVELAPQSAAANFIAGLVKRAARDLPAANAYWNTALEKDADFLPARQAVAEQALAHGNANAAEEYIVSVVRREPANFEALCIYARALAVQGKTTAASLIARRALAADSSSAEPHLILGNLAMQEKHWASAFIEYQQAILLDPDSAQAMSALARVYRKGRITRPLLEKMERVAANPPPSASLMEIVGRLYADRGWHTDAERALRKAATIDPGRATTATLLALTYLQHGKQRAAADSLTVTGGGAAQLIAGMRAAEEKDVLSAIRSYESAVRSGERTGTAANNLAWIYAQQGIALDRALELAQFARGLAPRDPAVLDTVGFVQLRRREYSQAVETLKQAVDLAHSPAGKRIAPEALHQVKRHLAEAYLRSGQPGAAAILEKSLP
jgi:tetratricopeptide (TPR) repeat protein